VSSSLSPEWCDSCTLEAAGDLGCGAEGPEISELALIVLFDRILDGAGANIMADDE